jgi:hypothetical protein
LQWHQRIDDNIFLHCVCFEDYIRHWWKGKLFRNVPFSPFFFVRTRSVLAYTAPWHLTGVRSWGNITWQLSWYWAQALEVFDPLIASSRLQLVMIIYILSVRCHLSGLSKEWNTISAVGWGNSEGPNPWRSYNCHGWHTSCLE